MYILIVAKSTFTLLKFHNPGLKHSAWANTHYHYWYWLFKTHQHNPTRLPGRRPAPRLFFKHIIWSLPKHTSRDNVWECDRQRHLFTITFSSSLSSRRLSRLTRALDVVLSLSENCGRLWNAYVPAQHIQDIESFLVQRWSTFYVVQRLLK